MLAKSSLKKKKSCSIQALVIKYKGNVLGGDS